ncbi:MAG: hypothetical protein ACT4QG_12565, partial [Sporichthyaceae bacterium]
RAGRSGRGSVATCIAGSAMATGCHQIPVAAQGFAQTGARVGIEDLHPEPTLSVAGIWWHPVAIADPAMQVATEPLPLRPALETIRDTLAVQDAAAREGRRHVFRCA